MLSGLGTRIIHFLLSSYCCKFLNLIPLLGWAWSLVGWYFLLPSEGESAALSTDAVGARVRCLPQSYFGKCASVPFFRVLQQPGVFCLSGLYLTLKTVKGGCSPLFPNVSSGQIAFPFSGHLAKHLDLREAASLQDLLILLLPFESSIAALAIAKPSALIFIISSLCKGIMHISNILTKCREKALNFADQLK